MLFHVTPEGGGKMKVHISLTLTSCVDGKLMNIVMAQKKGQEELCSGYIEIILRFDETK